MSRPIKYRRVCHYSKTVLFTPTDFFADKEPIILTVDEYETLCRIDKEGYGQEKCVAFMQIARTTVQRIYESARKKVVDCIVDGCPLRIEGGDFWLCNRQSTDCGYDGCYKQICYE